MEVIATEVPKAKWSTESTQYGIQSSAISCEVFVFDIFLFILLIVTAQAMNVRNKIC